MTFERQFNAAVLSVILGGLTFLGGASGCAGDGGAEEEPWADENGAQGEPSGIISGTIGGAAFNATIRTANFQENQSSFSISGLDTVSFPGEIVDIGLSVDRDIIGVGQFDCSVLGEAQISARIPVDGGLLGQTSTFVRSHDGYPCTITIHEFGSVGQPITGSFSGSLIESGSQGVSVSGTFNAVRGSVVLNSR